MPRVLVALLLFALPLAAQEKKAFAPLVERFEQFVKDGDTAGAVVVVGTKDGIKFVKAVGSRARINDNASRASAATSGV